MSLIIPAVIKDLRSAFFDLWTRECAAHSSAYEVFSQIEARYTEPHRAHHGLQHLSEMLGLIDLFPDIGCWMSATKLAIFGHDLVYEIGRDDNEDESAVEFGKIMREGSFSLPVIGNVQALIRSTKIGAELRSTITKALHDVDYWVVGSDPERYEKYARGIAFEYSFLYGPEEYRNGRKSFLTKTLAKAEASRLFETDLFHESLHEQALTNLRWEIDKLACPTCELVPEKTHSRRTQTAVSSPS